MSTDRECSGVHCFVAALVGLTGLVWSRGLGLTEEAGWLECSDCTLFVLSRWGMECRLCPSSLPIQRVFQKPPPTHTLFGRGLGLAFFYMLVVLLNHGFSLVPQGDQGRCGLWDLGLTEVAGWLLCVGSAPVQFIKVGG